MPREFTGRCRFCRAAPADSREHAPPLWFLREYDDKLGFTSEIDGESVTKRSGDVRQHRYIVKITLPACKACNNSLDKRFERPAQDPIRALMRGRITSLDGTPAEAFALWALKNALIHVHPDITISDSTQDAKHTGWDLSVLPDLYGWMTSGEAPPAGIHVWISKHDPRGGAQAYKAPILRDAHAFTLSWSFLAAGEIAFDLVYDPTDAVEHPLENQHEATRIWPMEKGETVDIGSLPYASLKVGWTPIYSSGDVEILRELLNP